jgi:hypothetical protein
MPRRSGGLAPGSTFGSSLMENVGRAIHRKLYVFFKGEFVFWLLMKTTSAATQ